MAKRSRSSRPKAKLSPEELAAISLLTAVMAQGGMKPGDEVKIWDEVKQIVMDIVDILEKIVHWLGGDIANYEPESRAAIQQLIGGLSRRPTITEIKEAVERLKMVTKKRG
jgi:hypothetical protein